MVLGGCRSFLLLVTTRTTVQWLWIGRLLCFRSRRSIASTSYPPCLLEKQIAVVKATAKNSSVHGKVITQKRNSRICVNNVRYKQQACDLLILVENISCPLVFFSLLNAFGSFRGMTCGYRSWMLCPLF